VAIKIKFEGNSRWTLRNMGGDANRSFYLLEALRKEGVTQRLSTGEGPHGTFGSVKTEQLDEVRRRMAEAGVEEVK
jgi:hypothetical protein